MTETTETPRPDDVADRLDGLFRFTEWELQIILGHITGEISSYLRPGLKSHYNFNEEQSQIHAICLELERRGLIRRRVENKDHIEWESNAEVSRDEH